VAVDAHDQHVARLPGAIRNIEGKRQIAPFMLTEALAVQPHIGQITHRVEAHENPLTAPAPR